MPPTPIVLNAAVVFLGSLMAIGVVLLLIVGVRLRKHLKAGFSRVSGELGETQRVLKDLARRIDVIEQELKEAKTIAFPKRPMPPSVRLATSTSTRQDSRRGSSAAGPTLIAIPNLAASHPDESETAAVELGRRFGGIWELADSGSSPEAIARHTGQPVGQVELILALRRQLESNTGGRM
jgi:hypothetical protein